jgi:hypothetical protein
MSSLRGPKYSKVEKIFIILTEGNIKNKHETDVNKSVILALMCKDDCAKLR